MLPNTVGTISLVSLSLPDCHRFSLLCFCIKGAASLRIPADYIPNCGGLSWTRNCSD